MWDELIWPVTRVIINELASEVTCRVEYPNDEHRQANDLRRFEYVTQQFCWNSSRIECNGRQRSISPNLYQQILHVIIKYKSRTSYITFLSFNHPASRIRLSIRRHLNRLLIPYVSSFFLSSLRYQAHQKSARVNGNLAVDGRIPRNLQTMLD